MLHPHHTFFSVFLVHSFNTREYHNILNYYYSDIFLDLALSKWIFDIYHIDFVFGCDFFANQAISGIKSLKMAYFIN